MERVYCDYIHLMDASYTAKEKIPTMTYLNLSTMTIVVQLDGEIDIGVLNRGFKSPSYPLCTITPAKDHHEYELTSRGKKKKSFYNQTTIQYRDHTTKSIKVFSNGRLQVTGITSVPEARDVATLVCNVIDSIPLCSPRHISLVDVTIAMINTNFSYNCGIDIVKLQEILQQKKHVSVSFDPDRYPGLNVKHTNSDGSKTSVLFFGTGNVVITGVKSFRGIQEAFSTVTTAVFENFDNLKTGIVTAKAAKKATHVHSYEGGYPKRDLRCVGYAC